MYGNYFMLLVYVINPIGSVKRRSYFKIFFYFNFTHSIISYIIINNKYLLIKSIGENFYMNGDFMCHIQDLRAPHRVLEHRFPDIYAYIFANSLN